MTYLNLMNNVLRRLREEETTSVTSTTYNKMVSDFINDAKKLVEESNDWSALRSTITVSTTADDNTYSLTDCGDNVKVMCVLNDTSNVFMEYQSKDWLTSNCTSITLLQAHLCTTRTAVLMLVVIRKYS